MKVQVAVWSRVEAGGGKSFATVSARLWTWYWLYACLFRKWQTCYSTANQKSNVCAYCNTIYYRWLELANLIHLVPECCGVVVSMLAHNAGDEGSIPVSAPTQFSISGFHGRNLLSSFHRGKEKALPQFRQCSGPVTSCMHVCSGNGRHVIILRFLGFQHFWCS